MMLRALLWLLIIAALATGGALLGRLTEGYVLWVLPPWRVELSFNLFVLLQLALLAAGYLLLRLIINTLRLPAVVAAYRARRAKERRARVASEALRLFWEGRYSQALKLADAFAREKVGADEAPFAHQRDEASAGIVALTALKAAHALRDAERSALWQARAVALDDSGWRSARLMTLLQIALEERDFARAREVYHELNPQERRRISVLRLALRLAQGENDWAEALRIARLLERRHALSADQARPLRLAAQRGLIMQLAAEPAQLMRHWRGMAADERADAQLARLAARQLAAAGACAECAELVEAFLDVQWEPALLDAYAACPGGDELGRIAHCEKWLTHHPQDADLLFALGRLCLRRELWGKAQSYLEAALAVAPSCAAHLELARLLDRLERPDEAARHYRAAAALACPEAPRKS